MKQKTSRGHQYGEAFMLMTYECRDCGYREIFWNARDGVTPFGHPCSHCEHGDMFHVNWDQDCYAPEYCPLPGQGVWIDIPREIVPVVVRMTLKVYGDSHDAVPHGLHEALEAQYTVGTPWLLRWPDYRRPGGG